MATTLRSCTRLVIAFICLLATSTTFAASQLTAPMIEQWIESQSAFAAWGEKNEQQLLSADNATTEQSTDAHQNPLDMSVSSLIQPLKSSGLYHSASELVKRYHFNSLEQWADITIRITSAAAAIELEKNPKALDISELEALQHSSQLPPEQKALITQAIKQNQAMVKQFFANTTDQDKQAVQPFLKRIHHLMDATE